jgi:hypothetical protein
MQNEENKVLGLPDVGAEGAPTEGLPTEQGAPVEPPKDEPKDKEAEEEALRKMMYSPSASDADPTLEINKSSEVKEEKKTGKDLLKMLEKNGKESDKYRKELMEKALKDPDSVQVETPNGWMSVRQAITAGFNFGSGQFDREPIPVPDLESKLAQLSPREQETIRRLTKKGTGQATHRPTDPMAMMPQGGEQPNPMLPQDQPIPETQVPGAEQGSPLQLGAM